MVTTVLVTLKNHEEISITYKLMVISEGDKWEMDWGGILKQLHDNCNIIVLRISMTT